MAEDEQQRVPSRVQARDEPCADPASCDIHQPMRLVISTRPQDWAEPAREILRRRGVWRQA